MPPNSDENLRLEIGHVLFIDIAALKKVIDEHADDSGSQIAAVYALRKEADKVFEWLEHARATHDGGETEMLLDPFLRAYKDDPRFIAFAQKIGVMPKGAAK